MELPAGQISWSVAAAFLLQVCNVLQAAYRKRLLSKISRTPKSFVQPGAVKLRHLKCSAHHVLQNEKYHYIETLAGNNKDSAKVKLNTKRTPIYIFTSCQLASQPSFEGGPPRKTICSVNRFLNTQVSTQTHELHHECHLTSPCCRNRQLGCNSPTS